jgi:hypothetical protein
MSEDQGNALAQYRYSVMSEYSKGNRRAMPRLQNILKYRPGTNKFFSTPLPFPQALLQ